MADKHNSMNNIYDQSVLNNILSDLYVASQKNDYLLVLELLKISEYKNINRREANGSTALHAAATLGHADIVTLLLHKYSVIRDQKDSNNCTAYEVACNDEIRQLFHRPKNSNRFYSDSNISKNLFDIRSDTTYHSNRIERFRTVSDVKEKRAKEIQKQVPYPSRLYRNSDIQEI